jgi:hypothetical protein
MSSSRGCAAVSSAGPSMCWKIRQSSRSDTEAISLTCGRHRSPLVPGMRNLLEPHRMLAPVKTASKAAVNLLSRSRIKNGICWRVRRGS